jgi:hypothetical protein
MVSEIVNLVRIIHFTGITQNQTFGDPLVVSR